MDLGNLKVYLELDTKDYDEALSKYQVKTASFTSDLQRKLNINLSLKPSVDDSALTRLNKHLDLKEKHFRSVQRYFNTNPLTPRVNVSEIDRLISKVKEVNKINIRNINKSYASSPGVELKIKLDTKDLEKTIKNIGKGGGFNIGSILTAPFRLASKAIGSIFTGIFEGIGTPIGRELGEGIKEGIQSEFSDIIGSFKLLGRQLAKELTKDFIDTLSTDIKGVRKFTEDILGKENIVNESASVRYRENKSRKQTRREASQQVYSEMQDFSANKEEIKNKSAQSDANYRDLLAKVKKFDRLLREYEEKRGSGEIKERIKTVDAEINELSKANQSEFAKPDKNLAVINSNNARLRNLANTRENLYEYLHSIKKEALTHYSQFGDWLKDLEHKVHLEQEELRKIFRPAEALDFVDDIEKHRPKPKSANKPKRLTPGSIPEVYKSIYEEVAKKSGQQPDLENIPSLTFKNLPSSVNGAYSPDTNKMVLNKQFLKEFESGEISEQLSRTLIHEFRHAFQSNLGKNIYSENPSVDLITPTLEEAKKIGGRVESSTKGRSRKDTDENLFSKEYTRKLETDAYLFEERYSKDIVKNVERKKALNVFNNEIGVGGGVLTNELANAQMIALTKAEAKSRNTPFQNLSRELLEDLISTFDDIKEDLVDSLDSIEDIELLPVEEIQSLQNLLKASLNNAINSTLRSTASFFKDIEHLDEKVRSQLTEILPTFSKKELQTLYRNLDLGDPRKLGKKQLMSEIMSQDEMLPDIREAVLEKSREKAKRKLERQEQLTNLANNLGSGARVVRGGVEVVGQGINDIVQSTPVQVAGHLAAGTLKGGYKALETTENIAFGILSGGNIKGAHAVKGIAQNTVVPALLMGGVTHFLPGGQAIGEGLTHIASGAVNPLVESLGSGLTSNVGTLIHNSVPNVFGMQTNLISGATEAINAATGMLGQGAAEMIASLTGGTLIKKGIEGGIKALPFTDTNIKALPSSSDISSDKTPEQIASQIASDTKQMVEDAIIKSKNISSKFRKTYADIKRLLGEGNTNEAKALAASIDSLANSANKEIQTLRDNLKEVGALDESIGGKLANAQSQISKARKNTTRKLKKDGLDLNMKTIDINSELLRSEDIDVTMNNIKEEILSTLETDSKNLDLEGNELYSIADIKKLYEELVRSIYENLDPELRAAKKGVDEAKEQLKSEKKSQKNQKASQKKEREEALNELVDPYEEFKEAEREINSKSIGIPLEFEFIGQSPENLRDRILRIFKGQLFNPFLESLGDVDGALNGILDNLKGVASLAIMGTIMATLGKQASQVAMEFERLETAIQFASGSSSTGDKNIAALNAQVDKYKVNIREAYESYTGLAAAVKDTSLEDNLNEMNEGFLQAVSTYQLDPERQHRLGVSLQQMLSKGTISSEEVRGQASEALPGFYQISARAMNITPRELNKQLEQGLISSEDFVPRVMQQLKNETFSSLDDSLKTTQARTNSFNNEIIKMQKVLGERLLPGQNLGLDLLTKALEVIQAILPSVMTSLVGFSVVMISRVLWSLGGFAKGLLTSRELLFKFGTAITTVGKAMLGLGVQMAVFVLIGDLISIISDKWKDASNGIKDFAKTAKNSLNEYKKALDESQGKQSNFLNKLPKTTDDLEGESFGENSTVGKIGVWLIDRVAGEGKGLEHIRADEKERSEAAKRLGIESETKPQKVLRETVSATDAALKIVNETIAEVDKQINDTTSSIQKLANINNQLQSVQAKKRATDPNDLKRIKELQAQEDALIKQRDVLNAPFDKMQAGLQMQTQGIEDSLKAYDELAVNRGITLELYTKKTGELKEALKKAKDAQEQLNKAIGGTIDQTILMIQNLNTISAKLQDSLTAIDIKTANKNTDIIDAQANGIISEFRANIEKTIVAQDSLNAKASEYNKTIKELQTTLNNPQMQEVLKNYNLVGAGSEQIRAVIENRQLQNNNFKESRDGRVLESAANTIEKINDSRRQIAEMQGQVSEQRLQTMQSLKDMTRSMRDYFQSASDAAEDLESTISETKLDTAVINAKNKLERHLKGFSNRFFGELTDSITSLIDTLYAPLRETVNAQNQMRQYQRQLRDQLQQGNDLLNSLTPGGTSGNTAATTQIANSVVNEALSRVGTEFRAGVREQCANFVRDVLEKAGVEVGVTLNALDNLETGAALASSFFGQDIGTIIRDRNQLQAGDLLAFGGTYDGYSKDTITHVGIYTGNGQMVDRSTSSAPVRQRSIDTFEGENSGFLYAVRPHAYGTNQEVFSNSNHLSRVSASGSLDLPRLRDAIAAQESGGDYHIVNEHSGALGKYQVMPANVPDWSQRILGQSVTPDQFLASPQIQDRVVTGMMEDMLRRAMRESNGNQTEAIRRVASEWYSGRPELFNDTRPQYYGGGQYPSIAEYTSSIVERYNSSNSLPSGYTATSNASQSIDPSMVNAGNSLVRESVEGAVAATQERLEAINQQAANQTRIALEKIQQASENSIEELQDVNLQDQRRAEDLQIESLPDTPRNRLQRELRMLSREEDDSTRDVRRNLRDAQRGLETAQRYRDELVALSEQFPDIKTVIPGLDENLAKAKEQVAQMEQSTGILVAGFAARRQAILDQYSRDEEARKLAARQAEEGLLGQLTESQTQWMNRYRPDRNRALTRQAQRDANIRQFESGEKAINLEYDSNLAQLKEQLRLEELTNEEYERRLSLLDQLRQVDLANLNQQLADQNRIMDREDGDYIYSQDRSISDSRMQLLGVMSDSYSAMGFDRQSRGIQEEMAYLQQQIDFSEAMRNINQMREDLQLSDETVTLMKSNLMSMNEIKLDSIREQFTIFGELLPGLQSSFQNMFSGLLEGAQSFGEVMRGFLQSIVQQLANLAAQFVSNEFFGFLTGRNKKKESNGFGGILDLAGNLLGGILGGGSSGGDLGLSSATEVVNPLSFLSGFKDGGVVDGTVSDDMYNSNSIIGRTLRREGAKNQVVLAALTKGERVLTIAENREFERQRLDLALNGGVKNFRNGGVVGSPGSVSTFNTVSNSNRSINVPITINGGSDISDRDAESLRAGVEKFVTDFMIKQSRPGGINSR